MADPLRVLIIEDSEQDAELLLHALRRRWDSIAFERVQTAETLTAALDRQPWDIAISDYRMPAFDALAALALIRKRELDLPFIIVSGTIGEAVAVEAMKAGANDYVMKSNLARLGPAVQRELREAEVRKARGIAEQKLHESETKYRELIEQASDGIFQTDAKGNFLLVNSRYCEMLGYREAELLKLHAAVTYSDEERELLAERVVDIREKRSNLFERMIRRKDGTLFPVEVSVRWLANGTVQGIVRDITERKKAQWALTESEFRFRQLTENIAEVFWLTDPDKNEMLYVSPGYEAIWGRTCKSLYEQPITWLDAIHPDDRARVLQTVIAKQARGDYDEEYRIVRPDGSIRWVRDRAFPVVDPEGKVYRIAGVAEDITERKRAADELRESERRYSDMVGKVELVSLMLDTQARITYCNDYLLRLTGWKREEVFGRNWFELFIPSDNLELKGVYLDLIADLPSAWHHENEILTRAGERRLIRWNNSVTRSPSGEVIGTASIGEDITELKEQQEKIVRLNRIYAILSGINSAIVRVHERQALFEEACRIAVEQGQFGMAWIGLLEPDTQNVRLMASNGVDSKLFDKIRVSARADVPEGQGTAGTALRSKQAAFCNDITADPTIGAVRAQAVQLGYRSTVSLPLLVDGAVVGVVVLYARETDFFDEDELKLLNELAGDISFGLQYIEKEERLDYLAYYDALTGLPNSTLFHDRLIQFLESAKHNQDIIAVILIDLDRFTQLNDTLGRHVGDTLLQQVAKRFAATLRAPYSLARISADEFAVAVTGLQRGADAATIFYERLFQSLGEPITVGDNQIRLSARAGIALYPNDGQDAATLFKNAEAALKQAQTSGERYLYYAPEINANVAHTLALESKLRDAVEREQFVLHYQPKIDTQSGRVVGLEALIRWNNPETGLIAPGVFISVLEASGLILGVGQWVMKKALSDYRRWRDAGLKPPRIAVNVSPVQFRREYLANIVREVIESSGVGPDALELEITESVLMEDMEMNTLALKTIGDMGVKIAIDDFGTGYSSLRYLAKLPVDTLKIDRSFIVTMVSEPESMAIVSSVISLAHLLEMNVVAEGVDSKEQVEILKRLKCDEMQGYLFSKPVSAERIEAMLGG